MAKFTPSINNEEQKARLDVLYENMDIEDLRLLENENRETFDDGFNYGVFTSGAALLLGTAVFYVFDIFNHKRIRNRK